MHYLNQHHQSRMEVDEYVVAKSRTPLDLASTIAEPILTLLALAALYFFGVDWFLDPILSFFSQFDWFGAVVAIGDSLSSLIEWLDSLNGTGGPSFPFGLSIPSERVLDVIFTIAELVIGIAVVVESLNASILAVRSDGVTINDVSVPWSSIRQVVIVQPNSSIAESDEVRVGLRLDPDAPLPEDLSSLEIDSSSPSEIPSALCTSLDGHPLNRDRLLTAVHGFSPSGVPLIEIQGNTERELKPQDNVTDVEYLMGSE